MEPNVAKEEELLDLTHMIKLRITTNIYAFVSLS